MPMTTIRLRLDRVGDEQRVPIAPGTPARLDAEIDIGSKTDAVVTTYGVVAGPAGEQLIDLSKPWGDASLTVSLSAADLVGMIELRFRVTTAASTSPTLANAAISQDVPGYVSVPTAGSADGSPAPLPE